MEYILLNIRLTVTIFIFIVRKKLKCHTGNKMETTLIWYNTVILRLLILNNKLINCFGYNGKVSKVRIWVLIIIFRDKIYSKWEFFSWEE